MKGDWRALASQMTFLRPPPQTMRRSKAETEKIVREASHLRSLLKEFGLELSGWDPGVLAFQPTGRVDYHGNPTSTTISFDRREWEWLEPLLIELRDYRRKARKRKLKSQAKR